jgi:hypothetical protein
MRNNLMVDRELTLIETRKKVNVLLAKLGKKSIKLFDYCNIKMEET